MVTEALAPFTAIGAPTTWFIETVWWTRFVMPFRWYGEFPSNALRTRNYHTGSQCTNVNEIKALTTPDLTTTTTRVGEVF